MSIPRIIIENARRLRRNMTKAEIVLWGYLKNNQTGVKILRQKPIHIYTEYNGHKRFIIADFYIPEHKIVIELDGGVHNIPDVSELDTIKTEYLEKKGIQVLRFENNELINNISEVLGIIKSTYSSL